MSITHKAEIEEWLIHKNSKCVGSFISTITYVESSFNGYVKYYLLILSIADHVNVTLFNTARL